MRLGDSELSLYSQQNLLKYIHSSPPPPPPPSAKNNLLQSGGEPPRFFWIQGIIYCDLVLFQCAAFLKTIHVKSDHCRQNILSVTQSPFPSHPEAQP